MEQNVSYVISKQIFRSGTSIGANIAEAQRGQSKADFAAKMIKETYETDYWLRLLHKTGYINSHQFESLNQDNVELIRLLTSICKTANASK